MLAASLISDASAFSPIPTLPVSIKQTFSDGSFIETFCEENAKCFLRYGNKGKDITYAVNFEKYGYADRLAVQTTSIIWTRVSPGPFVIAFEVPCNELDQATMPKVKDYEMECVLHMSPKEDMLQGSYVEIRSTNIKKPYNKFRDLTKAN